jgi:hypothetical protein
MTLRKKLLVVVALAGMASYVSPLAADGALYCLDYPSTGAAFLQQLPGTCEGGEVPYSICESACASCDSAEGLNHESFDSCIDDGFMFTGYCYCGGCG